MSALAGALLDDESALRDEKHALAEESGRRRMKLGERGQIYVTLAAARRYAEQRRLLPEEARRELTIRLRDAHQSTDGSWRYRSRTNRVDISAVVIEDQGLLVVVASNTRDY